MRELGITIYIVLDYIVAAQADWPVEWKRVRFRIVLSFSNKNLFILSCEKLFRLHVNCNKFSNETLRTAPCFEERG